MLVSWPYKQIIAIQQGEETALGHLVELAAYLKADVQDDGVLFLSYADKVYFRSLGENVYLSRHLPDLLAQEIREGEVRWDPGTLEAFLTTGFIVAPYTLFEGVYVLPTYSVVSTFGGTFSIKAYYPPKNSLRVQARLEDFEDLLIKVLEQSFDGVPKPHKTVSTFSGGADSALLLALIHDHPRLRKSLETTITCRMTGLQDEADRAKKICEWLGVDNHSYIFDEQKAEDHVFKYIELYNNIIYDNIFPVYVDMVEKIVNSSGNNIIVVEGQGADSIMLGLPHNILLNLHGKYWSWIYRLMALALPEIRKKHTRVRRGLYRLRKVIQALGEADWRACLLSSLGVNLADKDIYTDYLLKQLGEYCQNYGSKHKAVAYFFMFRILPAREMQKYQLQSDSVHFIRPFMHAAIIDYVFASEDQFYVKGMRRKKPIFALLKKKMPAFFNKEKTSPFYVKYRLNDVEGGIKDGRLVSHYGEVISRFLNPDDPEYDLKVYGLNRIAEQYNMSTRSAR